ncbi:hypothetical protein [Deinococcus sp.]|uniref:hypothetical protein n=1 Tax=Deinococcus sp. TaxID=47478 RepID=UPI003CC6B717
MSRLFLAWTLLLTLVQPVALAKGGPDADGSPAQAPSSHRPPAPNGPPPTPLGFDEARTYAARAAAVARQLQAGAVQLWPTAQGPRLSLSLTYQGRPVGSVFLGADLSFAERGTAPLLPDAGGLPILTAAEHQRLQQYVQTLVVSGLAVVAGPQVRVALLSQGAAVADLRFDRTTGKLLAEPGGGDGGAGHGKPAVPKPPKR